ncbi:GntR family transcriptional regulator [Streptococcus hillyeri]|uniref:GntR family transcriptional regulator n=1 Tax=Streptococcus hillyeri TaxID=2282420 RepID=A0A3L9DW43_9STRE|nr:GntR family transcriptional regulator [Streptococcus hillyeri]RLY05315.1 GntR family transcriptional regulator [Streptococcus hillyeri]
MKFNYDSDISLFQQVAQQLEESIFQGIYAEGDQVPSTTEISAAYQINPATVLKGMNLLVAEGVLEKRRGTGTFVTSGALAILQKKRRTYFSERQVHELVHMAKGLGLEKAELLKLIEEVYDK